MPYYRITIELKGKTVTGVREYESNLDMAYTTFKFSAEQYYGSKMLHFDCVQLADRSEEVQTLIKQKGKTGKTRYQAEPDTEFGIDPINEPLPKFEFRRGPGKYKDPPSAEEQARESKKWDDTLRERIRQEKLRKSRESK